MTFRATVTYDDGTPAAGALVRATKLSSGDEVAVLEADRAGGVSAALEPGDYAFAVSGDRGLPSSRA